MSVLSVNNGEIGFPFYPVGDLTFAPGATDNVKQLKERVVHLVEALWPAHKASIMLPDRDTSRNMPLVQKRNLPDHQIECRNTMIWEKDSNVIPAISLRKGIIVSVDGYDHRAMLLISWRHAAFGGIGAFFHERWLKAGEKGDVESCYVTPFVSAEQLALSGNELTIVESTRLSIFLHKTGWGEPGSRGFDLSLAVKHQLECCFGRGNVTMVNSPADHFGHPASSCSLISHRNGIPPDDPTPGIYLGAQLD